MIQPTENATNGQPGYNTLVRELQRTYDKNVIHFFLSQKGCEQNETLRALLNFSDKALGKPGLQALVDLMVFCQWDVRQFRKEMYTIVEEASRDRKNSGVAYIRDLPQRIQAVIGAETAIN